MKKNIIGMFLIVIIPLQFTAMAGTVGYSDKYKQKRQERQQRSEERYQLLKEQRTKAAEKKEQKNEQEKRKKTVNVTQEPSAPYKSPITSGRHITGNTNILTTIDFTRYEEVEFKRVEAEGYSQFIVFNHSKGISRVQAENLSKRIRNIYDIQTLEEILQEITRKEEKRLHEEVERLRREEAQERERLRREEAQERDRLANRTQLQIFNEEFETKYLFANGERMTVRDFNDVYGRNEFKVDQIIDDNLMMGYLKYDKEEIHCVIVGKDTTELIDGQVLYLTLKRNGRFQYGSVIGSKKTISKYQVIKVRAYTFQDYLTENPRYQNRLKTDKVE